MGNFSFEHVCLEAWSTHFPERVVTSLELENRFADIYRKIGIPLGTLERLSGISERRLWDDSFMPSHGATKVAKEALSKSGFTTDKVGALINCSVSRDYFEPATAALVHRNIELNENAIALDISNACIGFSNGIMMLGAMIDQGSVDVGIVVSCEHVSQLVNNSLAKIEAMQSNLNQGELKREEFMQLLPTLTLGSGAVAYVLCHEKFSSKKHFIRSGAFRSATQFNQLCMANGDHCVTTEAGGALMKTDSQRIVSAACELGTRVWPEASKVLGWSGEDINYIFCHQVGKQVNQAFYAEMGLDVAKEFTIYKKYGNLVSAALPSAVAIGVEEKAIKKGDKILCTAYGSGLNGIFYGIEW
jgi:3-oxoacyl-[acyl-carrier-protein] synthase-3